MAEAVASAQKSTGFICGLGLLDSTMIGSGIFPASVLGFRHNPTGFFNY